MSAIVQTVLGPISPTTLGRTLTHEHMFMDYTKFYSSPPEMIKKYVEGELSLKNIGFVQRYPYSNSSNLVLDSPSVITYDVSVFKDFGGGAIVDNTSHGLKRDVTVLKNISEATGVHIIAGTGYYLASVQSAEVLSMTAEEMYKVMLEELTIGCVESKEVKCGFMGEVASDYPIHAFEVKAIEAAGELQGQLLCPVSFHSGRDKKAPFEVMRRHTEAGGVASKTVMSHLDRTLTNSADLLDFAKEFSCFLQYDLFGTEVLTYQFSPATQMPSDRQRIDGVRLLIAEGLTDRVLLSHDVHTKQRLLSYGGHGYMHILGNVVPKMLALGVAQEEIDVITVENPARWLQWIPPTV